MRLKIYGKNIPQIIDINIEDVECFFIFKSLLELKKEKYMHMLNEFLTKVKIFKKISEKYADKSF